MSELKRFKKISKNNLVDHLNSYPSISKRVVINEIAKEYEVTEQYIYKLIREYDIIESRVYE